MNKFKVGQIVELRDTNNFPNYRMIITDINDRDFSGVCVSLSSGIKIPDMHVGLLVDDLQISDWCGIIQPFDLGDDMKAFSVGDVVYATYGPEYSAMVSVVNDQGGAIKLVVLTGDEAGQLKYFPLLGFFARQIRTITFNPITPMPKIGDIMAGYGLTMIITDVNHATFTGTVIDSADRVGLGVVKFNQPISQFHHTPQGPNDQ